jgi:hypothetical protein
VSFRRWRPSSRRDRRRGSRRSTSTRDDRSIFVVIGFFVLGIVALLILLAVFG